MGGFNCLQDKMPINAWLLAATVPAALCVSEDAWLGALCIGILCSVQFCFKKQWVFSRWFYVLQLLWMPVFLAFAARESAVSWEDASLAIPIILILLGAVAAHKGCARAADIGRVLAWVTLPVLLIVFLAGVADIRWEWISASTQHPNGILPGILLLPSLAVYLPVGKKADWLPIVPILTGVVASLLIQGTCGVSFYEFSKGITLLGVAERFEAFVTCTLTMGWFALLTWIFSVIFSLTEKILPAAGSYGVWIVAAIAVMLVCILPKNDGSPAWGTLIFWGLLPLLAQGLGIAKKVVKKQK